ncbi:MAG: MarC family protein [Nanoarchaeota archaeon]
MELVPADLLKAFFVLFVAMDVPGNIPLFITLTSRMEHQQRKKSIKVAVFLASILLLLFLFLGNQILKVFNIQIDDFKIAGGIILAIIGIKVVLGLRLSEKRAEKYELAVVPMATPLVTGPAVITTVIILVDQYGLIVALISACINLLIAWFVLNKTDIFFKFLGRQGSDVLSRIFGLILVAMAIGFIRGGL